MKKAALKGLALILCAGMGASALSGCGRKAEASAIFTYNGEAVDNDTATFLFRLNEAQFDELYGSMLSQYYGTTSIWNMDLTGQGESYGDTFRSNFADELERLLVAQDHASDYDIALTDEEEQKIDEAADKFLSGNRADTLEAMSATKDTVVSALRMETIQQKVEDEVAATADTEVTDEEAAQRRVSYICYQPTTETESGTETEGLTEADTENNTQTLTEEAGETETEASAVTPVASESETAVGTEASVKTKSQNSTDASEEGQTQESVTEQGITEAAEQTGTESDTEAATESETETEDPAMQQARAKYKAMAEEELKEIQNSDRTFSEISDEISSENLTGVTTSTMTFGKDDSYPASEIIEATNDLDDDTLVDHVVEANDYYYILHVDEKLDRDATETEKQNIIEQRKQDAISDQYTEWEKDVTFTTDDDEFAKLAFDRNYTAPETTATEASTEAGGTEAETGSDASSGTETESAGDVQEPAGTEAETENSPGSESGTTETESISSAAQAETGA